MIFTFSDIITVAKVDEFIGKFDSIILDSQTMSYENLNNKVRRHFHVANEIM